MNGDLDAPDGRPLPGPVLAGTDLTPGAEEALRQAALLARDLHALFVVCHILPELLRVGMLFPQSRAADPSLVATMRGRARDAVRRELSALFPGDDSHIEILIDSGTAHVGLLEQADTVGASIIVTGPGDTATEVVRYATVPVLVARRASGGVVIGATDFSDSSEAALRAALTEATRRHLPLHLIHVLDVGVYALGDAPADALASLQGSAIALEGLGELEDQAKQRLGDRLRAFGVEGHTAVLQGHAAPTIVAYAESVDAALIVVGTHGRSGFARLALGSTAADVVESAPCSVWVARSVTRDSAL